MHYEKNLPSLLGDWPYAIPVASLILTLLVVTYEKSASCFFCFLYLLLVSTSLHRFLVVKSGG